MTNPYAPPRAVVRDIVDPSEQLLPADRGTRLGATLLDGIVFAAMVYAPLMAVTVFAAAAGTSTDSANVGPIFAVGALLTLVGLIAWVSLTVRYVRANGQSIGKKLVGIKVVRTDGSPVSLGRVFWLRNFVNGLISIVPLYGLVDMLFIFGESRQCLHDKIADTIVVRA